MTDYVIEFLHTARIEAETGGMVSCVLAKVHIARASNRWPSPRAKPHIALVGDDESGALDAIRLWLEVGAPSMDEAKAQAI